MEPTNPRRRGALTLSIALVWLFAWMPLSSQAQDISKGWRFTTGDDVMWAQPEFDDSSWKPIDVGKPWEKSGYTDYDGYGWYRLRVRMPKAKSESAYFKQYKRLTLLLG